jgi:hypothetical protein
VGQRANRIINRAGGVEYMQAIGFQISSKDNQKYFLFPQTEQGRGQGGEEEGNPYFDELNSSLSWLRFFDTYSLTPSLPSPHLP